MALVSSTQRTNTSRTNVRPKTRRAVKKHHATNIHPKRRFLRFPISTIGILCLGGSCCAAALFGMGIFSSLRSKAATSSFQQSAMSETTANGSCSSFAPGRMDPKMRKELENKLRGALWGFFAGDALSSPTHWFYGGQRQIVSEYGHSISDYTKPNQHLAGSILNKSDPNGGGRMKSFSKNSDVSIIGDIINHGKLPYWAPNKSYHYHATLQKGESTLEVSIARVLMKSIVATGGNFDPDHFREAYVSFMQTPGSHNDTYASTCHRMFFANLIFRKLPPKACPDNDSHNVDTMDGLVLPTIVALAGLGRDSSMVSQSSGSCTAVTRKSKVLEDYAGRWSRVVLGAFGNEACFSDSLTDFAQQTIRRRPNPVVREASTMSACYLGQSLPGLIDMVAKHAPLSSSSTNGGEAAWDALLANANVGGENVHRGSILGAILGARAGYKTLPPKLVNGLYAKEQLEQEIEAFVGAVLPNVDENPNTSTS